MLSPPLSFFRNVYFICDLYLLLIYQAEAGWLSYLNDLDEIIIDVPLAVSLFSTLPLAYFHLSLVNPSCLVLPVLPVALFYFFSPFYFELLWKTIPPLLPMSVFNYLPPPPYHFSISLNQHYITLYYITGHVCFPVVRWFHCEQNTLLETST